MVALDGEMLDSRSYLIILAARVQWQVVVSGIAHTLSCSSITCKLIELKSSFIEVKSSLS